MPGEWSVVSESPAPDGWNVVKEEPAEKPGAFSRFVTSVTSQLPTPSAIMGGIKEWWNRPEEIGKAMDALHVLNKAASLPENKGKPPAQWKEPNYTPQEKDVIDRGLNANLGSTEGPHPLLAPAVRATQQASEGDLAGAGGTLLGGYGVPAAAGAAVESMPAGTGAGLKSAVRTGGKDVAVGAAKVGGGVALPYAASMLPGPLGKLVEAPAIAGGVTAVKGLAQMGRGMAAGYEALLKSIAESKAPTITDRTPIWQQPGIKPADIPSAPADPTVAPQPRPITAPQDIQPPAREPIWKGLPAPSQEKFGPQETPARPQLPSGRKPGGAAIDTTSGQIVNKQTAGDVGTTQFEGAYPISAEERTGGPMAAPKEAYQRAARTVKARALARYLRIGGIPLDDAHAMTAEQWGMAADGAGVNVPSPESVKLALSELEKLYTSKGAVKIDDALRRGNLAEAHFYANKVAQGEATPARGGIVQ